jgi:hypothetical protein
MSLLKHEILQPVQHFNMHDDPLTNIETLHLVIWDKGLCVAGYDLQGNVLTAKVYSFSHWNIAAIESVFVNEPLVAGPQPVTHIWIAEERSLIVPQHLYTLEAAMQWLVQFHFIEAGETIHATTVRQHLQATVVYPLQDKLHTLLQKYFAEGKIDAISGMLLCQESLIGQDTADLTFLDKKAVLTIRSKGKLATHQVTEATDINNLVYKIASICEEHNIKQDELKISLSGFCITSETITELRSFFPKMTVPGSEQFSSFTLLSKLISCVS